MSSTKIIVVQLKELIMTILFAVLGLILLGLLIYILIPKDNISSGTFANSNTPLYIPGNYTSSLTLGDSAVDIKVSVNENEIIAIELINFSDDDELFYPLVKPTINDLSKQIIENQSMDFDLEDNNIATAEVLMGAIEDAIMQAKHD